MKIKHRKAIKTKLKFKGQESKIKNKKLNEKTICQTIVLTKTTSYKVSDQITPRYKKAENSNHIIGQIRSVTKNNSYKFSYQILLRYKRAVNSNHTIGQKVKDIITSSWRELENIAKLYNYPQNFMNNIKQINLDIYIANRQAVMTGKQDIMLKSIKLIIIQTMHSVRTTTTQELKSSQAIYCSKLKMNPINESKFNE